MPTCKTNPPPGQDINVYIARMRDIVQELNASNDKDRAIGKLTNLIALIKAAVKTTNPDAF
jgi:hypothetical protein